MSEQEFSVTDRVDLDIGWRTVCEISEDGETWVYICPVCGLHDHLRIIVGQDGWCGNGCFQFFEVQWQSVTP